MNGWSKLAAPLVLAALGCTDSADVFKYSPANGTRNVASTTQVVATFSRQMQAETVTTETFQVVGRYYGQQYPAEGDGKIVASEDGRTFTFKPGKRGDGGDGYVAGDEIHVNLTSGIVGVDRIAFEGFSFVFFVAGKLPDVYAGPIRVDSTVPPAGASQVPLGTPITIAFTRVVATASVGANLAVFGSQTGYHAGTLTFVGTSGNVAPTVVFTPTVPFLAGEEVLVALGSGITGTDTDDTAVPYSFSFTVASGEVVNPWEALPVVSGIAAADLRIGELRVSSPGLEAAVLGTDGAAYLLSPKGSPPLTQPFRAPEGTIGAIGAADVLSQGKPSFLALAVAGNATEILFLEPSGAAALVEGREAIRVAGSLGRALASRDFNGDARPDLILAGASGLALLVREGDPLPAGTPPVDGLPAMQFVLLDGAVPATGAVDEVVPCDLNADGRFDLLMRQGTVLSAALWEGQKFGAVRALGSLGDHGAFAPVYLDADRYPEIALLNFTPDPVLVLLAGEATGPVEEGRFPVGLPVPTAGRACLLVRDTSGDGIPEIMASAPSWTDLYTIAAKFSGQGLGLEIEAAPAPGANALAIADSDGDAALEIFAPTDQGVWILEAEGGGQPPTVAELAIRPEDVEFLEDGTARVIVRGRSVSNFDRVRVVLAYNPAELQVTSVGFPPNGFFSSQNAKLTTCLTANGCTDRVVSVLETTLPFNIHDEVAVLAIVFKFLAAAGGESEISLRHGLADGTGALVDSAVRLSPEGVWVRAGLFDATLVLASQGAFLKADCTLEPSADGRTAQAKIAWSSPRGAALPEVVVRRNGIRVLTTTGPGTWTDTAVPAGTNRYEVTVSDQGTTLGTTSCQLVFVPSPAIEGCVVDGDYLVVTWEGTGACDGFHLWRDGTATPYKTLAATEVRYQERDDPTGAGHLFGVSAFVGTTDSMIAFCSSVIGGAAGQAKPPRQFAARSATLDPFAVDLTWVQGEGYESLTLFRDEAEVVQLGLVTSYQDQMLQPGTYTYRLVARARGQNLAPVVAAPITVMLPLNKSFSCRQSGASQVTLTWENGSLPFTHFSYDRQVLGRTWTPPGGSPEPLPSIDLDPKATTYTDTVAQSAGTYAYVLTIRYDGAPYPLEDPPTCSFRFATELHPVSLKTGAALQDIRIPIEAKLAGGANEVSFRFRYAGGRNAGEKNDRLVVTGHIAGPGVTIEASAPVTTDGLWYSIDVRAQGPVGPAERATLVEFLARTASDFALFGYDTEPPVADKRKVATQIVDGRAVYPGQAPIALAEANGTIEVCCRYLFASSAAGLTLGDTFSIPALGTFEKDLVGFNLAYSYKADVLEAIGETIEESDTPAGLFYASSHDNVTGIGLVAWIANFQPLLVLPKGFHRVLAHLQFKVRGSPGSGPELVFEPIELNGQRQEPMLNPLAWVVGTYLELGIGAEIEITAPPEIAEIRPLKGPLAGGTRIEIFGKNFGAEEPAVTVRAASATVLQHQNEYVLCRVPALAYTSMPTGPVSATISVQNSTGVATQADVYRYMPLALTSLDPPFGPLEGGGVVRINGDGMDKSAAVSFGGQAATIVSVDESEGAFLAVAPPARSVAGPVDVEVRLSDGQRRLLLGGYTYGTGAPQIARLVPDRGQPGGGTTVRIEGSNLTGVTAVLFGTKNAQSFTEKSSALVEAVSPAGQGQVTLLVRTGHGDASATFRYEETTLAITDIAPRRGTRLGGTRVHVLGAGFDPGTSFFFGGAAAASVEFQDATSIYAVTPAAQAGQVSVEAQPSGGGPRVAAPVPFQFVDGPAGITDFQPRTGPAAGGTVVTVTGSNFIPETAVTVGGAAVAAGSVEYAGETQLRVTMPPGTGSVKIAVANPGTAASEAGPLYAYTTPAAAITGFTPERGSRFGDTLVRIQGSGFFALTRVYFGTAEVARERITVVSDSVIEAFSPARAPGAVRISVQNPGLAQVSGAKDYVYEAFAVAGATPASGSICGGVQISITGTSFHDGIVVRFDSNLAAAVDVQSEYGLLVETPAVPEATAQARIELAYAGNTIQGPIFTFTRATFLRGDANGDGRVNRDDAQRLLDYVNGRGTLGATPDAADVNDDGRVNLADAQYLFGYVYGSGQRPKAPFPDPGTDPTPDGLTECAGE